MTRILFELFSSRHVQRINRELINETESQTRTSDLPNLEDLEVRLRLLPTVNE